LAAVLAALVPSFASYAFLATQETTLVMFGALGFLALLKATRAKRPGYAIVGGLLLGGAALTSYQGLYFILPVVVLYAIALLRRWNRGCGRSAKPNRSCSCSPCSLRSRRGAPRTCATGSSSATRCTRSTAGCSRAPTSPRRRWSSPRRSGGVSPSTWRRSDHPPARIGTSSTSSGRTRPSHP